MKPWTTAFKLFQINYLMTSWWVLTLFKIVKNPQEITLWVNFTIHFCCKFINVISWVHLWRAWPEIYTVLYFLYCSHLLSHPHFTTCFIFLLFCSCSIYCPINRCRLALWPSCLGSWCTPTRSRCCLVTTGSLSALPSRRRKLSITGWNVSLCPLLC